MGNQYDIDDEIEIDLKDLLLEIISYWKLVMASVVLIAGIVFAVSKFVMIPKYESTAVLYVLTKSTSITSLADIQTGTSLTNDYLVVVKGRPVLEQVISNLVLEDTYKSLYDRVDLNNPSNSRLLEITVTDEDPQMAKVIADEIAQVSSAFIAAKMDQDPPTIIQNGYADGAPVSPSIMKNTLLGGIAGGMFAVGIVVIAYLLNDTIIGPEDIEKKLGMNVLGSLPLEESEDDGEQTTAAKGRFKGKREKRNKKKKAG